VRPRARRPSSLSTLPAGREKTVPPRRPPARPPRRRGGHRDGRAAARAGARARGRGVRPPPPPCAAAARRPSFPPRPPPCPPRAPARRPAGGHAGRAGQRPRVNGHIVCALALGPCATSFLVSLSLAHGPHLRRRARLRGQWPSGRRRQTSDLMGESPRGFGARKRRGGWGLAWRAGALSARRLSPSPPPQNPSCPGEGGGGSKKGRGRRARPCLFLPSLLPPPSSLPLPRGQWPSGRRRQTSDLLGESPRGFGACGGEGRRAGCSRHGLPPPPSPLPESLLSHQEIRRRPALGWGWREGARAAAGVCAGRRGARRCSLPPPPHPRRPPRPVGMRAAPPAA